MTAEKIAYLAIKYHPDHKNRNLIDEISYACQKSGYKCFCVARDVEKWGKVKLTSEELMKIALLEIKRAAFVLIDYSEKGVGIGIEAGYAFAHDVPIIVIYPSGAELSNTLSGIITTKFEYKNIYEITDFLKNIQFA